MLLWSVFVFPLEVAASEKPHLISCLETKVSPNNNTPCCFKSYKWDTRGFCVYKQAMVSLMMCILHTLMLQ